MAKKLYVAFCPKGIDFVDLAHIDIQTAELKLLADSAVAAFLRSRVARMIVGTHSPEIHAKIANCTRWRL